MTAFDSPVLGAGTNGSVVITGPPVTPLAWIGLAPSGQCNPASNHVATLPFVTPLDLPLLPAAATLAVCYSVDNGTTFVEQSLVSFEVGCLLLLVGGGASMGFLFVMRLCGVVLFFWLLFFFFGFLQVLVVCW